MTLPTEAEAIAWLWGNWPSLFLTGILVKAYLKLRGFVVRIDRLEQRQRRHMVLCGKKQHPELGAELFDDGNGVAKE